MNESILPILITFIAYIAIIFVIAYLAKISTKDLSDYVLAGRRLSGPIVALGAGASDMSSWLLMALPGLVYVSGLNTIWMPIALSIGAYCNWRFIAKRLRIYTEVANDSLTIPAYFDNRFHDKNKILRIVSSLAIIVFFTFYAAAGFVSGAILTNMTFGIDYLPALFISAGAVVIYTAIGGFLAVSWIDFFQGILMFVAIIIVPVIGFIDLGGIDLTLQTVMSIDPTYLNPVDNIKTLGLISLFAWGLGYFGQPHINVRFMAVKSTKELPAARRICMSWMVLSLLGAVLTGLVGFAFYSGNQLAKPETIFIMLSHALFNPWMVGILLSAILSAIMSTVAAQILMTASILVEDFYHTFFRKHASNREYLWAGRILLLVVAAVAIWVASKPGITILRSVAFAWSGLGASFGPVIIFSLYWRRMTLPGAICGVAVGAVSVVLWRGLAQLVGGIFMHPDLLSGFEILPGFVLSAIAIIVVSLLTKKPGQEMLATFDEANGLVTSTS